MLRLTFCGLLTATFTLLPPVRTEARPVVEQCPQAQAHWTVGYEIWDLIELAPEQYKRALVRKGPTRVRIGVGFDADIAFTLPTSAQVTVTGEAWDAGCNHWMRVLIESEHYWMHGSQLRFI